MGLDLYFYVEDQRTSELIEFAYYRKFNALFGFMYNELLFSDNPVYIEVNKDVIQKLFDILSILLECHEKADELLPVCIGPFFGSYDYGEIYWHYVRQCHRDMNHLLLLDDNQYKFIFAADY